MLHFLSDSDDLEELYVESGDEKEWESAGNTTTTSNSSISSTSLFPLSQPLLPKIHSFPPLTSELILPFAHNLRENSPWYGHEEFGVWPHKGSALSLGESNTIKYGTTFPLRTGLENSPQEEEDFVPEEVVTFLRPVFKDGRDEEVGKGRGVVEEIYLNRGVCIVSLGPLGGPCAVKGLYRPLDSYGTGGRVKSVVKTEFCQDEKVGDEEKDVYYCLVENSGISLYASGRSECHAAYVAEFQIEKVVSCPFGLLVVPVFQMPTEINENSDSKFLYVLTHPSKQVSKVWMKTTGNDFMEFDASSEKLMGCCNSLCVFWDTFDNSGFSIKRLVKLKKKDIAASTNLNASIYYTNTEPATSPFTPAGGSSAYSPIGRASPRNNSIKLHREPHYKETVSQTYWPSFSIDFSNLTHAHGLATGFYPPHYCVYDDPEFYLKPLFHCFENPGGVSEPEKLIIRVLDVESEYVAVWYLIEETLFMYSIDVHMGKCLNSFEIDDVRDFICSEERHRGYLVVLLMDDNTVKIGFLDIFSNIVMSMVLDHSIERSIVTLDTFIFDDTIVCSLEDSSEKGIITLKRYEEGGLIQMCMEHFAAKLSSTIVTQIVALYMSRPAAKTFDHEWSEFVDVIQLVVKSLGTQSLGTFHINSFETSIIKLMEELTVTGRSNEYVQKLNDLYNLIQSLHDASIQMLLHPGFSVVSVYQKFLRLLPLENPIGPVFESLPTVMQFLLKETDSMESICRLSRCKVAGESFAPVVDILIADVFRRNQEHVSFDWPVDVLNLMGRTDYVSAINCEQEPVPQAGGQDKDDTEDFDWRTHVSNLRIFMEDRRIEEVCKLLDSSSPLIIDIEQKAEISDHDFLEDQERHLLQMMQITLSAPVGRAAYTLRTETKSFLNLTNVISIPKLCLTGKCSKRGTNIEINDTELTTSSWPVFHNAVAATLAVRFVDQPADAWFAYNRAKTPEGAEQAGVIYGFGLNGILTSMPATLQHDYLSKENSFMTMAMLLGLSVNNAGSGDITTWKVISLHIGAMLPACTTELEIPKLASLVAPCALGVLFMGTHNSHIAKVLLGEISKRYTPLSLFGIGNLNNSNAPTNPIDANSNISDREAHSLCAGFGLGFVNLGKGRSGSSGMAEDGFDGILRRFVVGGPKPSMGNPEDDELSQYGPTLPSLWEEYRCCHIEEGDSVNVDVATPSAIVAVALTYLKSGNDAVLKWLSPPNTIHLLDGVRPDILMLRSLAYMLVLRHIPDEVTVEWLQGDLMPKALLEKARMKSNEFPSVGCDTVNQAWASIVCGFCLGLGIRFAGTRLKSAISTINRYVKFMMERAFPENAVSSLFPKVFLESTLCSMMLALSLLQAGTGDISTLRILRYMQYKLSGTSTASSNAYGLEMCTSMAIGILFLGGGRYSLCNDDRSIAVILASVFPKWPISANDNRYHLQALRHLYILACQPRLILPKPLPHITPVYFEIIYLNGKVERLKAPLLLPPFTLMRRITLADKQYLPIEFNLPRDLKYLEKVVANNGVLKIVRRPVPSVNNNFLKQMAWREARVFPNTLPEESDGQVPSNELHQMKELNLMNRLAEGAGLKHVLPALVALKNGDPASEEWQLQIQILFGWTLRTHKSFVPNVIPIELLGMLLNKADAKFFEILANFEPDNVVHSCSD